MDSTKITKKSNGGRYLITIAGFTLLVIILIGYNYSASNRMTTYYTPLIDAAMEIKLEITLAHLWFEKIIYGDRNDDIKDVWGHLDNAEWYVNAMLNGDENYEGRFLPLRDPNIRESLLGTQRKLTKFKEITVQRLAAKDVSGIGTEIDQQYDEIFKGLIFDTDSVETILQDLIAIDLLRFRIIQGLLLLVCLSFGIIGGIIYYHFNRGRNILVRNIQDANSLKETLLDVITHDLKTPIGVICGMSEMMIEELPEHEMLKVINDSSNGLLKVIDNATTLSQVTFGEKIKMDKTDLVELIQEIAKEWKSPLDNIGMTLETDIPNGLSIKANPIISEVFKNYVSNAVKYASKGKKILINCEDGDGSLTINVKDFGETLDESKRQAVFIRSVQLEDGNKRGRGLGLAIVKRIAEAHNAEVGVKPNKPKGNVFYITIPTDN